MSQYLSQITDSKGLRQEVKLDITDYKAAAEMKLSLPQYLSRKFDTDVVKHGEIFPQLLASAGMFTKHDHKMGIKPPTMAEVLNGSAEISMSANAISRPDGQNALTPSGRLLFPALIMEMVESELRTDNNVYAGVFNKMVANTVNTPTPRYDQPVINVTGPQGSKSRQIAQGAEPDRMISIGLSERSFRMPVMSIGLEITDEAQRASTLDLVGIAVREQALQERADRIDLDLSNIVQGNLDAGPDGDAALPVVPFKATYDSAALANALTHKGYQKMLRADWKRLNIDWLVTDIDGALAVEGRAGRPIVTEDANNDGRIRTLQNIANPGMPSTVNIFILDDVTILGGANRILALDSSKAIRKVIYVGAAYEAIQDFVMRRTTGMRFDWSERHERLGFDAAFKLLDYTNP